MINVNIYIYMCLTISCYCFDENHINGDYYDSVGRSEQPDANEVISSASNELLDKSDDEIKPIADNDLNSKEITSTKPILKEKKVERKKATNKHKTKKMNSASIARNNNKSKKSKEKEDNTSETGLSSKDSSSANVTDEINDPTTVKECKAAKTSESEEGTQCGSDHVNFPYAVSIQKRGTHYASGALYDKQLVLTAAADFFNVRESIRLFKVRLGSVNCKSGGILLPIKSLKIHPLFEVGSAAYDLAVIKLATPVNVTDYIRPIPLSTVQQKVISAKFLTTYWPRLIVHGEPLPMTAKERVKHNSMRVSTQRLIPRPKCEILMKSRGAELNKTNLCLRPISSHHTMCVPDVGAPVVAENSLWGITSGWTSKHCRLYPSPTLFTRVSLTPVRLWLEDMT